MIDIKEILYDLTHDELYKLLDKNEARTRTAATPQARIVAAKLVGAIKAEIATREGVEVVDAIVKGEY